MSSVSASSPSVEALWSALDYARALQHEDPAGSLALAEQCEGDAKELGAAAAGARALATQGMVALHRGELGQAFKLTAAAEALVDAEPSDTAIVEVAALGAHLNFFTGSYAEALRHAELSIAVSDRSGDLALRVYSRRCGCVVLGNLEVPEWTTRLDELMTLSQESGDVWEEAVCHNDYAHYQMTLGEYDNAFEHIAIGLELVQRLAANRFVVGLLKATRSEVHLRSGDPDTALSEARAAMDSLRARHERDPYLFGMCAMIEVRALLALGQADEAWQAGQDVVDRLGDGVPQLRSMILGDVAAALREAGRADDAYEALAASAELERVAYRQLSELQRDFERALHEQATARREADVLVEKNRELELRTRQLEELQEQLRDQAERDWLTGLYNRRYLAAALDRLFGLAHTGEPLSLAAVDLDHFKLVNDRFGHDVGDRVLQRAAQLLHAAVRPSDVVARTGGEEFVVLMPVASDADAVACAERLRRLVAREDWNAIAPGLATTVSIGVASTISADRPDALLKLADRRLYAAKAAGRDRVDATSFG